MLKILAILVLIYFFFRSVGYVLRLFLGSGPQRSSFGQGQRPQRSRPKNSNLNVDRDPQSKKQFDGGEYIDYEEVE